MCLFPLLAVSQVPNHNAVVVSGKVATQDYNEFWNDCFLMWELFYQNGWSNDHIHVIYGDGTVTSAGSGINS